ncbi:MAG: nucleotidyltransferase domain-containing protein [Chloroflexota bacterium]|nr:nucleotidyltransferase domain-containing protein [Chloroflexota bacterium]
MVVKPVWDEDELAEIIRRIVAVAAPERIVLFGSWARGQAGADSDFDLLVIKRGQFHRGHLTEEIYRNLIGVGRAVDVVIVTPEDVERYRASPVLVIAPALDEGQTVYAGDCRTPVDLVGLIGAA